MALDLSTLTTEQQIAAIYIGYYDRAADPFGEAFWVTAFENPNISLAQNASFFATQAETLAAYPFLGDPSIEEANAFITEVYLNLFNRAPEGPDDVAEGEMDGLTFWSNALIAAINGDEGALSVGEIILSIIQGAQGDDITTVMNKINVAVAWTDAADAAGLNEETSYTDSPTAQASAKSIIEGVTSDESTVTSAKADIDAFFDSTTPVVDGETYFLTAATDVMTGTDDNDEFLGYLQQNPFAGGISNSLSSAERLDGAGGDDRLYAELTFEFLGATAGGAGATDIQPRVSNIEEIDLEARDFGTTAEDSSDDGVFVGLDNSDDDDDSHNIVVDAKNIVDHEELSSYYSDGDLVIENVTTLTSGGAARNTDAITVGMDHTDNFNSDYDASDLSVYFDNDYLLSGQQAESEIVYFLLDEEAERLNNPDRLNNIDVDGIIFNVLNADGTVTEVVIEADAANTAGTHEGFVAALQAPFQAAIDAGLVPAGSLLFLDPTQVDTTFDDDGNESDDIPGIAVVSGDGTELVATGFSRIEEQIGRYDVYGDFRSSGQEVVDDPITVNIDLHKAGRGGEGGDLIVGGKAQNTSEGIADGIEVFKINVLGAGNDDPNGGLTKPSNVGTITSTGDELSYVYIATDPQYAAGDSYASLTVRNGFDENTDRDQEDGDLMLINADAFLGDLTLGDIDANMDAGRITNADMITAQGGGDVTLGLLLDGEEEAQAYTVYTGTGDDEVDIVIDGDATDYYGSSLMISTGDGNDMVLVDTRQYFGEGRDNGPFIDDSDNEQLNQAILDNIDIMTGAGDDHIESTAASRANLNINAGTGDDFIDTSGGSPWQGAAWAYNFDDARSEPAFDDMAGVPTSLAYIGGATITVTLSGPGTDGDLTDGGGIMAEEAQNGFAGVEGGAFRNINGYESTVTIRDLINGNQHFGDQRDVNAAIIEAIEGDAVLSKLLTVTVTENNTLVIESTTGGEFDPRDLKIEISQANQGSTAASWDSVEAEARSVFSNSGIVIEDLGDANGEDNGPNVPDLRTTFGSDSVDQLDSAHDWYTGLTAARDGDELNASRYTQIFSSNDSRRETDNVITPGEGDDLVVMSTEAGMQTYYYSSGQSEILIASSGDFGAPRQIIAEDGEAGPVGGVSPFTRIDGNTLQNGASNETLVFEGMFGDDTIMNFTTADPQDMQVAPLCNTAEVYVIQGEDEVEEVTEELSEIFTIALVDAPEAGEITFNGITITVEEGFTADDIAQAFEDESENYDDGYEAVNNGDGTVTFTGPEGTALSPAIEDFVGSTANMEAIIVGFVSDQDGGEFTVTPGSSATQETFYVVFGNAKEDATYEFDGVEIPVLEGQTGDDIAAAVGASDQYSNWEPYSISGNTVYFRAVDPETGDPVLGNVEDVTDADWVGANIIGEETLVETYNAGLDFLDYSDYLTSEYDSSTGPGPDSNDSNVLRPVVLDYSETNTLGGSGDGSVNTNVEANEVAVVRMANDGTDGETWGSLSAADVEALFNNDGSYTGFGSDSSFGNLDAANFSVQTYAKTGTNPTLIGEGKAIFKVENPGNLGEYKVFELTWSGDNSVASGATVTAKEIGSQDYGTSLTGLDDINLVGSDDYGLLIENGFANFGLIPA